MRGGQESWRRQKDLSEHVKKYKHCARVTEGRKVDSKSVRL